MVQTEVAGVFFCFQIQMKFNNWTFRLCCRSNKGKGMITFWCQTFFGAPLIEKCCLNNYSFDLVGNQSHSDKCRKKILNYCHTSRFSLIKGTQPEEWGVHRGTNWAAIPQHNQSKQRFWRKLTTLNHNQCQFYPDITSLKLSREICMDQKLTITMSWHSFLHDYASKFGYRPKLARR